MPLANRAALSLAPAGLTYRTVHELTYLRAAFGELIIP